MEFKERLKALRKEQRITQSKLGKHLNYGSTTIANYESGRNQPSIPDLIKIASVFGVSVDYLLGVTDVRQSMTKETISHLNQLDAGLSALSQDGLDELLAFLNWLLYKEKQDKTNAVKTVTYSTTERNALRVAEPLSTYKKDRE